MEVLYHQTNKWVCEGSSPELGTKAGISWEKRREGFGGGKEREAGSRKAKGGQEAPAERATLL